MNAHEEWKKTTGDPLGLSDLESIEPGYDGWAQIESALQAQPVNNRSWRRTGGWLAMAASLVLVVTITMRNTEDTATFDNPIASTNSVEAGNTAVTDPSTGDKDNIGALIGLSQNMEDQVKQLRQKTASLPAESAVYVAELEDLIAQVDNELSFTPDSIDLWGQRVNLLLDLAQIYQQQWQIDYGRMAAL